MSDSIQVVASIEHRGDYFEPYHSQKLTLIPLSDGTGPSSFVRTEDGKLREMNFINWAQLDWPDLAEQPKDDTILRHEQIKLRTAEIEECLSWMFARAVAGVDDGAVGVLGCDIRAVVVWVAENDSIAVLVQCANGVSQ